MSRFKSTLVITASFVIIIASLVFTFIMVYPFDVLKSWSLTVDTSQKYTEGDEIQVHSLSVKVIDAPADIRQSIECKSPSGALSGYSISTRPSAKKPGTNDNTFKMTIPLYVLNDLPTQCRISIDTVYTLFGIRQVIEHAQSGFFPVEPKLTKED